MQIAFVASEYNPFHNGHKYHISKTKEAGADAVVCVMSGNFVQRGEPAVAEKHFRAEAAILGGADLVIELPLKYAVSTASYFAKGFIDTVNATGINGAVSFGSSVDIDVLQNIKNVIFSEECENFCKQQSKIGKSYPSAKSHFFKEKCQNLQSDILNDSNNILALEYLNAIDKTLKNFEIMSVKRLGAAHDSQITTGEFASAGYIRRLIYEGKYELAKEFIPEKIFSYYSDLSVKNCFPINKNKFNTVAVSRLISLDINDIKEINNVTGGLENRIINAVKNSDELDTIYNLIKSKRFTHSKIRQIILNAVLGIKKSDLESGLSYIRVLAFNNKGREILYKMKSSATVPVISNLSQADSSNRDAILDYTAGRIFNLCLPEVYTSNPEYRIAPVYVDI